MTLVRRIVLLLLLLGFPSHSFAAPEIIVCFTPPLKGGCDPTDTIVQVLAGARNQILVQAYSFTSSRIAKAIVDAHRRGVEVRVILDKSNERAAYSAARFLEHSAIPVMIDAAHNIAHNKVMIVDAQTVITGSFNFTKSAEEQNAENLVVIRDPAVAGAYSRNWNEHFAHSTSVHQRTARDSRPGSDSWEANEGPVVGNRDSLIFAWPGCESFDTMSPRNRVQFPNRQAAENAGYHAAKNCP